MTTSFSTRSGGGAATDTGTVDKRFERKVRRARRALFVEAVWPKVWALLGLALAFFGASMLDLWARLPELAHKGVLALFGLAVLTVLVLLLRSPWPSREAALRRMERLEGVPHRPASAYEDSVPEEMPTDDVGRRIWQAHRERVAAQRERLRPGAAVPKAEAFDPFAVRALATLGVLILTVYAGDAAKDRLASAFRFGPLAKVSDARLDAWLTPPAYTGRPPVMLADGARGEKGWRAAQSDAVEVPVNSQLVVRASGVGAVQLEFVPDGVTTGSGGRIGDAELPAGTDISEVKTEIKGNGTVRVYAGKAEVTRWALKVIPDHAPKVTLTRDPERSLRGSLRVPYKVEDDYGVASLEGKITRLREGPDTSATAWARAEVAKKGPRPPRERPPALSMRLNQSYPKEATGTALNELADHPWAGLPVELTLEAKDLAGQVGRSKPYRMVLPSRQFSKPLAKAVVEQRRLLVDDPRYIPEILKALDALTIAPDEFISDKAVYLGLRSVYWRLSRDDGRVARNSAVKQLWQIALRIEDGSLSDAERALKAAQERLQKALENGATDEEIKQLMQELREAMNKFLQELARNAENAPPMDPNQFDPSQMLSSRDLEQMMQNLENMARSGNRDQAQQMLSELRDLMDRLQNGRMARQQGQGQQNQAGQQMMNELGELLGKQQQLLDDTFNEQRRQQGGEGQQEGQQGQQGQQQGQQGQQGQRGQRGQQGQMGQGQQGQGQGQRQGQRGQRGQGQQQGQGGSGESLEQNDQGGGMLGQRQQTLRDRLDQLQRGMGSMGLQAPDEFGAASEAMRDAERALGNGDLDRAAEAEARALDQLRQGARGLAQQMMQQMQRQAGQQPGQGPNAQPPTLDPLGRAPNSSDGNADPGNGVKVPDQIDVQRAREILEELRRRLGEGARPLLELEYLERLLKRF